MIGTSGSASSFSGYPTALRSPSSGLTMRWQKLQFTPSKSSTVKSSIVPLTELPASHAPGAWQRMQNSPALFASWFAIVSAACQTGSRAD